MSNGLHISYLISCPAPKRIPRTAKTPPQTTPHKSCGERKQRHIPGSLDRLFRLSLTTGAVAAALTRVYLAPVRQEFGKRLNVLVVNVFHPAPAKTALSLLTRACKTCFSPVAASDAFTLRASLSISVRTSLSVSGCVSSSVFHFLPVYFRLLYFGVRTSDHDSQTVG